MLYKLILKTLEHGTVLDRLMSYKICVTMPFTTTAKRSYQGQKTQECGTLWAVAIKRWIKAMKRNAVM